MNAKIKTSDKLTYCLPQIELVELDNEISLILQSTYAPGDPESSLMPGYFNDNPVINTIG